MSTLRGRVVATFGRRYEVEADAGTLVSCVTRARKRDAACGDLVEFTPTGDGQGVIEAILPRRTFLERADAFKRKPIAANADQILILVATEPWFSDEFITRLLVLAHDAAVVPLIGLNKIDLPGAADARARLAVFERAGCAVVEFAARPRDASGTRLPDGQGIDALRARLAGRITVLAGQSGMGKSSLVNALAPGADAATGEISRALGSGRHTTTYSRCYRVDATTLLIDCPGMQEVGVANLDLPRLTAGFAEFAPFLGNCRFADCRHDREPECALVAAVDAGAIAARRYELFCRLRGEIAPPSR
ncbi:MAG: ribosome small subunit-dependent GTPase A [Burkholderiales bacterium]|nr:ribosome small subunit-dependent GTPase A [Burkholderiales bacterium]